MRDSVEECSEMVSALTVVGEAENTGVTEFAAEACIATEVMGKMYVPSPFSFSQPDLQDLKEYFARPRLISRGNVPFGSRAAVVRMDVNQTTVPTWFPQMYNRLSGVYAIRFTMCFRVQVAATAFHQGLLALNWQYQVNTGEPGFYVRSDQSGSCTNLPHVRMDLGEHTMCELSVPFMFKSEYWTVKADTTISNIYGLVSLNTILPLIAVSGLAPPTYEFYAYMTDLELFGADVNASTAITLQGGRRVSVQSKEEPAIFSSTLSKAAQVARFVSDKLPMLSGMAGPTSWMLDIASGAAKAFGYSRPMLQDPILRICKTTYVSEGNVDVPASGFVVGPMQSNSLAFDGVFGGTDVDEMALKYVLSQYCQACVGTLSTTDIHAKVVYASLVSPSFFWFRAPPTAPYCNISIPISSAAGTNAVIPTGLMWWSSMFRYWRGSIVFRFSFAKTKFHGGRYLVSYDPAQDMVDFGNTAASGPEVVGGLVQPYGYSLLIDLKDQNEFEFTVPYIGHIPWTLYGGSVGSISMVCIDPLQSASSVSSTVPFMVEVKAGDDFELAHVRGNSLYPHMATTNILQQSGKVVSSMRSPVEHTIGEQITSAKQLIQIPHYSQGIVPANTSEVHSIFPWFYYRPTSNATPISLTQTFYGYGRIGGAIAQAYTWARGSTDFHAYPTLTDNIYMCASHIMRDSAIAPGSLTIVNGDSVGCSSLPKVISTDRSPLHVRIPAFQQSVRIPTWSFVNQTWYLRPGDAATPVTYLSAPLAGIYGTLMSWIIRTSSVAPIVITSTAAGDDACLAGYVGPSPVLLPNIASVQLMDPDWPVI